MSESLRDRVARVPWEAHTSDGRRADADDWEEYVNGPYGSTEYTEEDKRAYRERVMLARHTYAALLARLDASGDE